MRRNLLLVLVPALVLGVACGDDAETTSGAFDTDAGTTGTGTGTSTTGEVPPDMPAAETDSDSDATTGDGDGDPATDSDTTDSGDGDGDPTTTSTTGAGECGNGMVDIGEQCDGDDLNGFSCTDLGYDGGDLACDPVTCTYDASGCTTDGGGSGGGTTG